MGGILMKKQKFLAALLALVMVLTLLPVTAFADEGDGGESTDTGLVLNKDTVLQADGTYTITLEGYATGTTTTSTVTKDIPLDIVLVLDQSGSMAYDFSGNSTNTNADRRQYAMKNAVLTFISNVAEKYDADTSDHRMAIVTFGSTASTLQGWTFVDTDGKTTLDTSVTELPESPSGATNVAAGMTQAQSLHNDNSYAGNNTERQKVVIVFTDGVPTTSSEFSTTVANNAISAAKSMKDAGVTIYSIGIFTGVDSTQLYGDKVDYALREDTACDGSVGSKWGASHLNSWFGDVRAVDIAAGNRFLNYLSSNFTGATEIGITSFADLVASGWEITANATRTSSDYYLTATDSTSLNNVFTQISENLNTSSTSVTLDGDAVMKDILSDEFTLPSGYSADSSITVKTVAGTADADGNITWGEETATSASVTATANVESGTIEVTGFSYADNFISSGHPGEKIVVTISGIHPTTDAFTGTPIYTNDPKSGVYEDGEQDTPFQSFDTPSATLHTQSYVLDYAKPVTVNASDWSQTKIYALMTEAGTVTGASTAATGTYGNATSTDTTITYSPKTMNWNGYDSFYSFDNTENAFSWAKINFIPANNVYYEDSFVTNATTGTVGIEFSEDYEITTGTNSEQVDTEVHGGWQNTDLADDLTYSDGTAVEMSAGAKASFTFTGTGVDVYTRTNASSGAVRGKLYTVSEVDGTTTAKLAQVLYVDNLAVSGDYYQIPTLTFSGLEHGTYKLELTVYSPTAAGEETRDTYYLDGIRIYNPLSTEQETEDEVQDAYTETDDQNNVTGTELNALFTEVRDMLITAGNFTAGDTTVSGVVFIDDIDEDSEAEAGESTSVIGTYEELGPKNEVYLAAGQSIAFMVNGSSSNFYALGIKAPAGATEAEITNGDAKSELDINHSTDLYYEVTPNSSGIIVVKNTGSNLLSITKLKTTGLSAVGESGIMTASLDDLMVYSDEFDSLPMVAYSVRQPVVEEPEVTEPEETEPEVTEPEATEPEVPEIEIEIENPDPKPEVKPDTAIRNLVKKLFSFISKWF